jgi:hypothetical protein
MERTRRQNQNSYHDSDEVEGITVQGEISVDLARRVRTCCTCTVLHRRWVRCFRQPFFRPSTRTAAHAAVPPAYSIVPFRPEQRRAAQDKLQIPGPGRGGVARPGCGGVEANRVASVPNAAAA